MSLVKPAASLVLMTPETFLVDRTPAEGLFGQLGGRYKPRNAPACDHLGVSPRSQCTGQGQAVPVCNPEGFSQNVRASTGDVTLYRGTCSNEGFRGSPGPNNEALSAAATMKAAGAAAAAVRNTLGVVRPKTPT